MGEARNKQRPNKQPKKQKQKNHRILVQYLPPRILTEVIQTPKSFKHILNNKSLQDHIYI